MAKRGKNKHKSAKPLPAQAEQPAVELAAAADEAAAAVEPVADVGPGAEIEPAATPAASDPTADVRPSKRVREVPRRARDARSPFLVLADYEQRSLAHVAGLPEQLDAPGLWRGVAYRVGAHRLASGFDEVVEILSMPAVTPIPGAESWMLGVANVRGTLLPVVDLKQFLEGERTVIHESQRVLVVRQSGGDVAVTIDELFGQRSFVEAQGVDLDGVADGRYAHFIDRAYRVNDQAWGVFSLERLTRTPEFRQAAA